MLEKFAAFPQIQVIDLNAAMGTGANDDIVELLASRAVTRIGGGVRTPSRAQRLVEQGAHQVIVGTAAFNKPVLEQISAPVGPQSLPIALASKSGLGLVKSLTQAA